MLKTPTFSLMHFCSAFGVAYALTGSLTADELRATVESSATRWAFASTTSCGNAWRARTGTRRASRTPWRHRPA